MRSANFKVPLILAATAFVLTFQNCSVYQSPQRKLLEEKGIHFLGTSCEPFISPASLIELYGVDATAFVEVVPGENSLGRTCKISVPGAPTEQLGQVTCYFNLSARGQFNQWLEGAYSGSTRNPPTSWTTPVLEQGETAADRRFMNLTTIDSQSRVAEGYLRVVDEAPNARVVGVGALRTSGALVIQCAMNIKSSEMSRTVSRLASCANWDVAQGTPAPDTISIRDLAQCLTEEIVDLFADQTR